MDNLKDPPDDRLRSFEDELRRWAGIPPRTPAQRAARGIVARLASRPRRVLPWRHWPAWAALLVLALASIAIWQSGKPTPRPAAPMPQATLDENVVLIWLDRETPLYMNLQEPLNQGEKSP